jgi:prepilin-type N-terminal cleavage/methylation domain-containing protein
MMHHGLPRRGFTLIELAMALFVMALLMGTVMYTLSAQNDQRMRTDSLRSLDEAKELLTAFAVVNGRLPCPASTTSNGFESPAGGGACTNYYSGYLPARDIGFQPQDSSGYGLDAWGNRIRYAVSGTVPVNSGSLTPPPPRVCRPISPITLPVTPHFTSKANLRAQGIDCAPSDLVVCAASSGIVTAPPSCNTAPSVTNQNVVAAVIWSQGKNFAASGYLGVKGQAGDDERVNNKTPTNSNHAVFVAHTPAPSGAAGGEFDDLLVWIPAGQLYGRLVAAGVLP